jgi:preprotein translocase subunit SecA
MPGRRFSDGLHEALEAKERGAGSSREPNLATITLQIFSVYTETRGMTGTAET